MRVFRIFRGFWLKWLKIGRKIHQFIIFVMTTTRMSIEHLPFLILQNADFGPEKAEICILQGRGTIFSQNPIKIRGFQNFNSHPSNSEALSRIFTKLVIRHHTRTEKIALVYGSGRLNMAFRMTDFAARSSLFML